MGPASLKKPPPYKSSAKVNCHVWGVKAVNGNMVATAAVLISQTSFDQSIGLTEHNRLASLSPLMQNSRRRSISHMALIVRKLSLSTRRCYGTTVNQAYITFYKT
jgi:hypothetical protein